MSDLQNTPGEQEAIGALDALLILTERARLILASSLAVGLLSLGASFLVSPTFMATATLLPPQNQQSSANLIAAQLGSLSSLVAPTSLGLKSPTELYAGLLQSRTVADRIIDRFDLLKIYDAQYRDDAVRGLADRTKVTARRDGLIEVSVSDSSPERAASIANAYVEELARLNASIATTEAQQRRVFFEKELRSSQENLNAAQTALVAVGVPEGIIKTSPEAIVEGITRLRAQVAAQEVKVSTMRSYLTETSPEFRLAEKELASLRAQLAQIQRSGLPSTDKQSEYLQRYRDFRYQQTLLELVAKQYEAARMDESREGALVQFVDKASAPEKKSRPRRALVAIFWSIIAALSMCFYFLLREWINRNALRKHKIGNLRASIRKLVTG